MLVLGLSVFDAVKIGDENWQWQAVVQQQYWTSIFMECKMPCRRNKNAGHILNVDEHGEIGGTYV